MKRASSQSKQATSEAEGGTVNPIQVLGEGISSAVTRQAPGGWQ